jgi:hypothetical protein
VEEQGLLALLLGGLLRRAGRLLGRRLLGSFLSCHGAGTSFLRGTVKLAKKIVNDFLLASQFFSAQPNRARARAARAVLSPRANRARAQREEVNHEVTKSMKQFP